MVGLLRAVVAASVVLCAACVPPSTRNAGEAWGKIKFDLSRLDADGLRGPIDGKVSVAYEFCIPKTGRHMAEVRAIDRTVEFMPSSRGRIGATKDQYLCIGHTHQKDFRTVLRRLAELPYIDRIIECHFE